jgi:TolA-binding protein
MVARVWRRLREPPYVVAVPVLLVVLAVSVVLVIMSSGGDEPPARVPAPVHGPGKNGAKQGASKPKPEGKAEPKAAEAVEPKAKPGDQAPAVVETPKPGDPKKPETVAKGGVPATAAVVVAPPSPDDMPIVLTPDERRNLRRRMFDAYKVKKWEEAADAGLLLRSGGKLDWEAALNLAQALRFANRTNDAVEAFKVFLADFPDNKYAPEVKVTLEKLSKH